MQTLKEAREARGIKQKAVADAISVSRQTYADYEKHPERISIVTAQRICEFMGCSVSDIFFADEG